MAGKSKKKKDDIAISVKNVTKEFIVYEDKAYFLKERLANLKRNRKTKHVVLNDISLEIKKGECIGQAIFQKYLISDNDSAEGERTGGFGSTNK